MYTHILVPVDGSPTSNRGLEETIKLARLTGARLRLRVEASGVPVVLMGSDAEQIVGLAQIPVLLVRASEAASLATAPQGMLDLMLEPVVQRCEAKELP